MEFVRRDCDLIFDYADCAAVIAYSQTENTVVVSFRGSAAVTQILEQVIQYLTGMSEFSPTGGSVSINYTISAHT